MSAPPWRGRVDGVLAGVLWLLATGLNLWLARASVTGGVLTGEEASVSVSYVVAMPEHVELSVYATNFAGQVYYWVASHLVPHPGLFYGRIAKAPFSALLAPLVLVVLRRRLGTGRVPAVVGAVVAVALPGVALFSWMATENGLEAVWGLAGLLVVTSSRRGWPVGLVLAGLAASTYSAGMAWAAVIGLVALVRLARAPSVRAGAAVTAGVVLGAAVVLFPVLWWVNGPVLLTGGGAFSPSVARLGEAARLLGVDGSSYYFFSDSAAWVDPPVAVGLGLAVVAAAVLRPRAFAPYAVLVVVVLGLYAVSGNITGSRRLIALSVVAALAVGVVGDAAGRALEARRRRSRLLPAAVAVVLAALVVVPAALALQTWDHELRSGARTLPVDFTFPMAPGSTMPRTLVSVTDRLRSGELTVDGASRIWEGVRTFSMIRLIADRNGTDVPGVPTPEQIMVLYRESAKCFGPDCLPVPAGWK